MTIASPLGSNDVVYFPFGEVPILEERGWTVLTYSLLSILPTLFKVSLAGQGESQNCISSNSLSCRVWLEVVHERFSGEIRKMEKRESHSPETIAAGVGAAGAPQ